MVGVYVVLLMQRIACVTVKGILYPLFSKLGLICVVYFTAYFYKIILISPSYADLRYKLSCS